MAIMVAFPNSALFAASATTLLAFSVLLGIVSNCRDDCDYLAALRLNLCPETCAHQCQADQQ